ncbi:NAD-dependent succinate-semialdehyde dehydrogenase [Candidatus Marinimicrobia bacterium]|nr:NAD-dependent succinate-semialdehyde dehydrogenase [Candidatus Neomarinimicrobiota bacterium]
MKTKQLNSINPKNTLKIRSWTIFSQKKIETIVKDTSDAQTVWKSVKLNSRLSLIKTLRNTLKDNIRNYSVLMADEMGKPLAQGASEINKCIWLCNYYIANAEEYLSPEQIETEFYKSYISFQPLGLVFGIMPWNFPFWQVFRYAVPALIVGNGVLLKHASNVQGCANAIEKCFKDSGFPEHIFKNLQIPSKMVANVIENNKVAGVAFTGSTLAGRAVAKKAGEFLKKTVLELGGNDPYIILDDANIDKAVEACIEGRLLNTGQSCISAKRLIVTNKNFLSFSNKLIQVLKSKAVGDPYDEVDVGPLVSLSARDEVQELVSKSVQLGAKVILGGKISKTKGAYYPITIMTNVKPGMPAFDEEIFGPVFSIIEAENDEEAIRLANNSKYGLGAAVFTDNVKKGEIIANEKIEAGLCFVNSYVKSDPRLPFGGVKMSGYGRELSSYGLKEFVNIKTVVVKSN